MGIHTGFVPMAFSARAGAFLGVSVLSAPDLCQATVMPPRILAAAS